MLTFTGILNGIDNYNRVRVLVDDPKIITDKINDVKNPYHIVDDKLECFLTLSKYRDYYIYVSNAHKYKKVAVEAIIKRYYFDGKKGTHLLLKSMDVIDI